MAPTSTASPDLSIRRCPRGILVTVVADGSRSAQRAHWVLLTYRLPREPSTPRIAVWRRLKRLGVAKLLDGLVALPHYARSKEQLEWVADDIAAAGGETTMWIGQLASLADERAIVRELSETVAAEYRRVLSDADAAREVDEAARRRMLGRLRRELRRI